ncbi:MAG: porin [Phycisphaerales bacterium]
MNKLAQISLIASTAGLATAGSLELDRSYAADLRSDASSRALLANNGAGVQVDVGMRFNYTINSRDDMGLANPDDDTTIGFSFDDVEVRLSGDVTDNISATVSFDFGEDDGVSGNTAVNLEDAYADWAINDGLTLRIGQFVPQFSAEASTSEYHMTNGERSVSHEWLATPSWTQGIEVHFGGDTWSGAIGFNDGPGTWSTAFNAATEADYAFNARFDFFSDSDKGRFADQTSWRGSAAGWRLGAGVIFATYGETNPSSTTAGADAFWYTIDGAYEGDGWAVRAAFYGNSVSPDSGADTDSYGMEIGASMFFDDQWEGYVRFDYVAIEDNGLAAGVNDDYSFISGGVNYYMVPESHAAKMQFELGFALDETSGAMGALTGAAPTGTTPIGGGGSGTGFLGSDDSGELYASIRATFMF